MNRARFPFSAEQSELLLAFERCESLQALAELMAKDPSVVSRNLQRLAETAPVIEKVKGRWQITPLGLQFNTLSRSYLKDIQTILDLTPKSKGQPDFQRAALLIINAQKGLLAPLQERRNNADAEQQIFRIISTWRANLLPLIHIRHISHTPTSAFYIESAGVQFMAELAPQKNELIIDKAKSSAFTDTLLNDALSKREIDSLVICGFTANECIDATARQASELGYTTYVVGDATASFDLKGHDGKLYRAERIHKLVLANLHVLFARVISTEDLMQVLSTLAKNA